MKKVTSILVNTLILILGISYLFPIYIIVVNSFKSRSELYENMLALPSQFHFQYYKEAIGKMSFLNAFSNSQIGRAHV